VADGNELVARPIFVEAVVHRSGLERYTIRILDVPQVPSYNCYLKQHLLIQFIILLASHIQEGKHAQSSSVDNAAAP
jgi:hypothetical protein